MAFGSAFRRCLPLLLTVCTSLIGVSVSTANAADAQALPPELQGWQDWALHGAENRRCPLTVGAMAGASDATVCVWPHALDLQVDGKGGRFTQAWDVFAESWIVLPGDEQHWPRDVTVDGKPAAVVMRGGRPQLQLQAGSYRVGGAFQWNSRPQQLTLAPETGIVQLTVDGQRIAQPDRPGEAVSFGRPARSAQAAALELQVYRLVSDEIPVLLTTRLRLQVAGDAREEVLGRALPEGFTPVSLDGSLPARLDPDGRLRVQVRSGSHELVLVARGANVASVLKRPPLANAASGGAWPREEVWSFMGVDRLRVASAEGADGIDPAQANVPAEWRSLPAYRMAGDSVLTITERSRGLANADDNRLSLNRQIWLDFNHAGYTAVDVLRGQMRQQWRLDMVAPLRLQSARSGAENLLVTAGADAQHTGLELRSPALDVRAVSRLDGARASLPATGWDARFENVSGTLHLPAGHRLLAAIGPDTTSGSWWSRWGLWSLFGVILVVVFTLRLAGWPVALVAFLALLLTYQEEPSFIWLWANVLLAIGLAPIVPAGRLQRALFAYRNVSVVLLGVALLPLLWGQVRLALYPQLEAQGFAMPVTLGIPAAAEAPGEEMENIVVTANRATADGAPAPEAAAAAEMAETTEAEAPDQAAESDAAGGAGIAPPAPPPAVPAPEPRRALRKVESQAASSSYELNYRQVMQRYAPGTQIQTGPGIPAWNYVSYAYGWSGPVDADATVRFVFIGPVLLGLWRVLGVLLLALWFFALLQRAFGFTPPPALRPLADRLLGRGMRSAAPLLLLAAGALLGGTDARAASTPDPALLTELHNRLLEKPHCLPDCADISRAVVQVSGERLDLRLDVSALAFVALAVPSADTHWQIDTLTVDGAGSLAARRAGDGNLWVPLRPGARVLRMSGRIVGTDNLQLAFPQRPRVVDVSASGWEVSGVNEARLISGAIELARRQSSVASRGSGATGEANENGSAQFPAFVRVTRNFNLDLDWTISTVVERVAPERAAVTVEVPLVNGESVLTDSIKLRDGRIALVGLGSGEAQTGWNSGLVHSEALALTVPADAQRAEVWNFVVNPQWRVTFSGLPATLPEQPDAAQWVFSFYPRPGETLKLAIARPAAVAGPTLAIDSVTHARALGARSADETLEFGYRSTQGGRHVVSLPIAARITSVDIDGQPAQLRPEKGQLSIGLLPGEHRVRLQWQSPEGVSFASSLDKIDLHSPASNVRTQLTLPADRWPLFALGRGAGVGPAVLYWGELVALFAVAWLLGRWSWSPLRAHEWLLLGLGLSTQSWAVFATVALWLFAMRWRQDWPGARRRWLFNAVQLALAAFTFTALGTLVFSGIKFGFLSNPEMGVVGQGSGGNLFAWFRDQTAETLPQPLVVSAPMWIYKTLIFIWALWIAFALVRWLRFAWQGWSAGGFWRAGSDTAAAQPREPAAPPS